MKHADLLSERIPFFDGLPKVQLLGRSRIGEMVEEVLTADLTLGVRGGRAVEGRDRSL